MPNIFKFGVSNIKNKNLKRALDSEVANMVVEEGQKKWLTSTILYLKKKKREEEATSDRRCDKKHWGQRFN